MPLDQLGSAPQILALSGGGEDGAFGAGLLNGWSKSGTRPDFDIVTGVSTGALIAPFAFLGADYDDRLRDMFLKHGARDLMELSALGFVTNGSLYDTAPLEKLIEEFTPPSVLRGVAARHATGARLFVVTTSLDISRAVVWDMGAIARDGKAKLFRAILRASAAIPGMFPPVGISYLANGAKHLETHVDGGVYMPFLAIPSAAYGPQMPKLNGGNLFVVVNNTLDPAPQKVNKSAIGVSQQALTTMIRASARSELAATRLAGRQIGLNVLSASIDPAAGIVWDPTDRFAPSYMQALYRHGFDRAARGTAWTSSA